MTGVLQNCEKLTRSSPLCHASFTCYLYPSTMATNEQTSVVQVGELRIDRFRFEVKIRDRAVRLTRTEFELLWTFASESGRAFRREDLIDRVWGPDFFIDPRTVDVHIARLRRKLKGLSGDPPPIETVWGIGYRLRPPEGL